MVFSDSSMSKIRIAIIGGGPAGLSAAIELSRLPFVDWHLYEQKQTISEIGTGITLQPNTWRLLENLGASVHIQPKDFFRPADGHDTQYRNGITGKAIKQTYPRPSVPLHQTPCRAHRAILQRALLRQTDHSRIQTDKKLVHVEKLTSGKLRLTFRDSTTDEVDILVGADGIRSTVRQFAFPDYDVRYSGVTAYRTVVRASDAEKINELSKSIIFWYGTDRKWVYTCPLGGDDWEITCRIKEPGGTDRSSWGKDVNVGEFVKSFHEYCQPVQELLALVSNVKRFDYFSGPRLESVVRHGSVALIGDASHPLSGAFGAGAAFALEDSHVLAGSIAWAVTSQRTLADGLKLYDNVRSAHYKALYRTLDEISEACERGSHQAFSADDDIYLSIEAVSLSRHIWMYYHEADKALDEAKQQWAIQTA